MSDPQERLFNPDRFSPVHPEVVLRLPEGSTRTLWLASMLGSYLKWDGSRRPLRSVEEASGTFVSRRVAKRVREISDITPPAVAAVDPGMGTPGHRSSLRIE